MKRDKQRDAMPAPVEVPGYRDADWTGVEEPVESPAETYPLTRAEPVGPVVPFSRQLAGKIDGSLDLKTLKGRRMFMLAQNDEVKGLNTLRLGKAGDSVELLVSDWLAIYKDDIKSMDGEVRSGWAITLFHAGKPVLSWGSRHSERAWQYFLIGQETSGPWEPPLKVKVTARAGSQPGWTWYSFLPVE
jgi:hypothetical protein